MFQPKVTADGNEAFTYENSEDNTERGLFLDHTNSLDAVLVPKHLNNEYIYDKNCWHKVTVLNAASHDKEAVLKAIMDFVYPADLIPVMCRDDGVNIYFLIRNCGQAIDKICRAKMIINTPLFKLNLQIFLGFVQVKDIDLNMDECLTKVVKKRYNETKGHFDFSNFHKDPDFVDRLYCPLSYSRILTCVLNKVISTRFPIRSISLANNNISFIRNLGACWKLKHITKLDLRQNSISSTTELSHLRQNQLLDLVLDLNPICEKYDNEYSYIEDIRTILPNLMTLDGVTIPAPGFPRFIKNFVSSQDDVPLTDQFLRQYFTLYDSVNRNKLVGLYHRGALFSLSATYPPAQSTSNTAKLTEYAVESRNLLRSSDYSKNMRLLHEGPKAILETLCKLPRTEHDPFSFTVDVVQCNSGVVISVKGIFKEPAMFTSPLFRSFYRVFVLVEVGPKSFQIANETVHISNATTKEIEIAFKLTKPVITPNMLAYKAENLNENESDQMLDTISKLTTMNRKWSRKCLDETEWNIKEALIVFTELYKMHKIPREAFVRN